MVTDHRSARVEGATAVASQRNRALVAAALLLSATSVASAAPADAIVEKVARGSLDQATAQCARLGAESSEDEALRSACADAWRASALAEHDVGRLVWVHDTFPDADAAKLAFEEAAELTSPPTEASAETLLA